LDLLHLICF